MYVCIYSERVKILIIELEAQGSVEGGGGSGSWEHARLRCLCYHLVQVMQDKDEHVPTACS